MSEIQIYDSPTEVEGINKDNITDEQLQRMDQMLTEMRGETVGLENFDESWGIDDVDVLKKMSGGTSSDSCPDNAEVGDIYSDPSGELLWKRQRDYNDPMNFVVCTGYPSRIRFPNESEGIDFCVSSDAVWSDNRHVKCKQCPHLPKSGKNTPCSDVYNWIILLTDLSGIYHVRFSNSGYSEGKKIFKAVKKSERIWNKVFSLSTKTQNSPDHTWEMFDVGITTQDPSDAVKAFANFIHDNYQTAYQAMLAERDEEREMQNQKVDNMKDEVAEELGTPDSDNEEGFENTL